MSVPSDRDRHIRRTGDDYVQPFAAMLPQGQAWPRGPDTTLMKTVRGLCLYWGNVDGRAADLLERESDPRETIELLPDWERAFGLPDPCFDIPQTIGERQIALVHRMTLIGAQSRQFFIDTAKVLGRDIRIREYAPFMCGVSRVGDQPDDQGFPRWQLGPPEMRFFWNIHIDQVRYVWFRVSKGQTGVDPHLDIQVPIGPLCVFERWKPAHTKILYYNNTKPVADLTTTLVDATLFAHGTVAGTSGPSGTLTRTLSTAVLSANGTVTSPRIGTLTQTLGSVMLSAEGGAPGTGGTLVALGTGEVLQTVGGDALDGT